MRVKENKYAVKAIKYKLLIPNISELYSKEPPNTAPNIFEPKALCISLTFLNDVANIKPEKNIGNETISIAKVLDKILFFTRDQKSG